MLEKLADSARKAGGRIVPTLVINRPFHQHTGGWAVKIVLGNLMVADSIPAETSLNSSISLSTHQT